MCKELDAQLKNFLLKNRQNVAANVTKYRTEAGLKKKELAEMAGLAPVVITNFIHLNRGDTFGKRNGKRI